MWKNNLVSNTIKWFTNSQYTHVGFVLNNPKFCKISTSGDTTLKNGKYIWMSGTEGVKDVTTGKIEKGVQIVDLENLIKKYIGKVYLRKLKYVSDPNIKNKFNDKDYQYCDNGNDNNNSDYDVILEKYNK